MDFNLTAKEEAFRDEVRAFLDENLPVTDMGQWLARVREKRWVGFSWPEDVGGGGGEIMEQVILKEEMAKAYASEAFARIGIDGVQLHGAVGYTDEYDIQLYLKRSKWARPAFGDSDYHYERVAQLGGL